MPPKPAPPISPTRRSTLILIGGDPGSGKSTLARALAPPLQAACLDLDTISFPFFEHLIRADHNFKKSPEYRRRHRDAEYRSLFSLAAENLALGISCIAAAPFTRERADPNLTEHLSRRFGIKTPLIGIHITVTPEIQLQNLLQRGEARDSAQIQTLRRRLKDGHPPAAPPPVLWNPHHSIALHASALQASLSDQVTRILAALPPAALPIQ